MNVKQMNSDFENSVNDENTLSNPTPFDSLLFLSKHFFSEAFQKIKFNT